jgi:hypothetical protein
MRNLAELCGKTRKIRFFRATGRLEILGAQPIFGQTEIGVTTPIQT